MRAPRRSVRGAGASRRRRHGAGVGVVVAEVLLVGVLAGIVAPPAGAEAPSLSRPFPPLPSEPVRPAGSALPTIKRDCGFSVALTGGDVLWIYCDSTDIDASGKGSYFVNNTAAYGFAGSLTRTREPTSGGEPLQFIEPVGSYTPCVGPHAGKSHVIWPLSATVVPGPGGTDQVLIWFENLCHTGTPDLSAYAQVSVGLAQYLHDPDDPDPVPELAAGARVVNANLWPAESDGHTFGEAVVYALDGYHYLYRCRGFWGCQVARVRKGHAADPFDYRYWTGSGWSTIKPGAPTLALTGGDEPAGSFNVAYLPDMGVYAMGYIEFPGLALPGVDSVRVRVASDPVGPWSAPTEVPNHTDCGSGCYAGYVHAALSGVDYVGTTSYDQDWWGWKGGGQVRMVQSRVNLEPPPAGVCRSGFADVWSDDAFCAEILWLSLSGITTGFPDLTFRPGSTVTRQAMAAWFHREAGAPQGPFPDPGYPDVPPTHPFHREISWLAQSGITGGFPDGTFRPGASVTRQAMAAWFHRRAGSPPGPHPDPGFSDVSSAHPFFGPIAWLAQSGITTGYADGTFRPGLAVTRQAGAAYFQRAA